MSGQLVGILLLAVAGFLVGGVYSAWKTAKLLAGILAVCALLAVGGAIAWFAG